MENLEALKNLIQNDIIGSINDNFRVGNITMSDANKLRRLTHKLYDYIYSNYKEMEELNMLTDECLILDIDIIEKRHEEELAEKDKQYQQELAEKDMMLSEKDKEIALLKKQLEEAGISK